MEALVGRAEVSLYRGDIERAHADFSDIVRPMEGSADSGSWLESSWVGGSSAGEVGGG